MLMTAMTAQISAMRTTWAVLTELVLVIRDAWNDPRSSTALGATPLAGHEAGEPGEYEHVRADTGAGESLADSG